MRIRFLAVILLCSLFILGGCTVWKERPVTTWSQSTGGEGLERNYWKEVKAKNWSELERHLASNYVATLPEGSLDKAASLERLKRLQVDDLSIGEIHTEMNGTAIVITYTLILHGSRDGQPLPADPVRVMSVWQQQKSGWVAIAQSVSSPNHS